MLKIITVLMVFAITGCASVCETRYVKVGIGYKFDESDSVDVGDEYEKYDIDNSSPFSARGEAGCKKSSYSFGISHHSQWATGAPFNDDWEYHKTELFIDKEWEF